MQVQPVQVHCSFAVAIEPTETAKQEASPFAQETAVQQEVQPEHCSYKAPRSQTRAIFPDPQRLLVVTTELQYDQWWRVRAGTRSMRQRPAPGLTVTPGT